MSLTFFYAPMSTADITNLVFCELEVPHETVIVDLKKGGSHTADFLKINPNGKVPVLVHDGIAIWESTAITMYLGETFGVAKGLYPAPGPQRGQAMAWITWANVTLGEAVSRYTRNAREWAPAEERNAKAGEAGLQATHACLKILNDALVDRQFLVGSYTLADAHVLSLTDWLRHMKIDFSNYSNLNAWHERCAARPAYKASLAAMGAGA